uniref:Uncharacterized protein n=1 Tax=Oryza sativa subsp. japonica TaxID=39947 RepID=Q6Z8K8_ORYSJ|nr:hypothetical protein [Oryza sativa Japonica Group]
MTTDGSTAPEEGSTSVDGEGAARGQALPPSPRPSVIVLASGGHARLRDRPRRRLRPLPAPLHDLPASILAGGGLDLSPLASASSSSLLAFSPSSRWHRLIFAARRHHVAFSPCRRE